MEIDFKRKTLTDQLPEPLNLPFNETVIRYTDFKKTEQLSSNFSHTYDPVLDACGRAYFFIPAEHNHPRQTWTAREFVDDTLTNYEINIVRGFLISFTNNTYSNFTTDPPKSEKGFESILTEYTNIQNISKKNYIGKWIPEDELEDYTGRPGKTFLDTGTLFTEIDENEARIIQREYHQDSILEISGDGGITLI